MSVVSLRGVVEPVLGPPSKRVTGPQLKLQRAKRGCTLKIREEIGNYLLDFFSFFVLKEKRLFLRCSKMMSRNSIRLIKGQNRIELIYRVNNKSLKRKKKSMNFTSSETNCGQKRSLICFPGGKYYQDYSVRRFLL